MALAYFNVGTLQSTTSNSDYSPQQSAISYPTTRIASNGNKPLKVYSVRMYLAGYSASRTATISMTGNYSGSTSSFSVASGSAAANTGFKDIDVGVTTTPASGTASVAPSGRMYIGTTSSSGDVFRDSNGTVLYSNRGLWGQYAYVQVPVTPTGVTVSANQATQTLNVSWSGIGDWGDSTTSRGYLVRVSTSSSKDTDGNFSTTTTTATASYTSTSVSVPITGNSGATYYVQVYAYNELSSFSGGPKSVASSTASVYLGPQAAAPSWSDNMSNSGKVGVSYYGSATASSSASIDSITVVSSNLSTYNLSGFPSGNSYIVSGTPNRSGTASISLTATDSYGQVTPFSKSITIAAPSYPSWPDLSFKDGTASSSYGSDSISATDAVSVTASWIGTSPGLTLAPSGNTVTLSGTPSANAGGIYQISVNAVGFTDNATGITHTTPGTASVYINALPVPAWTDTTIDTLAAINKAYSSNVSASNTNTYELVGAPSWLSIGSTTGTLSGTPTSADITYGLSNAQKSFTIRANGSNESIEQEFMIDVVHPMKIFKSASGDFVYPSSQVERYDSGLQDFVPVQWIKRRNDANNAWEDIDLV
jgi:hypothetical protein